MPTTVGKDDHDGMVHNKTKLYYCLLLYDISLSSAMFLIVQLITVPRGKFLEEADFQFVAVQEPPRLRLATYHQKTPPKSPEPRRGL